MGDTTETDVKFLLQHDCLGPSDLVGSCWTRSMGVARVVSRDFFAMTGMRTEDQDPRFIEI